MEKLLGKDVARYLKMIDELKLTSKRTRYAITENEQFKLLIQRDQAGAMQAYWGEILARSHLAAATSILRNRRWVTALLSAAGQSNLLAFAAALRGFMESAADSATSLHPVPLQLAANNQLINRALSGTLGDGILNAQALEDGLIHFAFARKIRRAEVDTTPPSHNAKKIREYLKKLEDGLVPRVLECYQEVCDLTHPGASSVWMWLRAGGVSEFELTSNQEAAQIAELLREYLETIQRTVMFAFHPGVATLGVLNYFPLTQFHTNAVKTWNMSGMPLWQRCVSYLDEDAPRRGERLRLVSND